MEQVIIKAMKNITAISAMFEINIKTRISIIAKMIFLYVKMFVFSEVPPDLLFSKIFSF